MLKQRERHECIWGAIKRHHLCERTHKHSRMQNIRKMYENPQDRAAAFKIKNVPVGYNGSYLNV